MPPPRTLWVCFRELPGLKGLLDLWQVHDVRTGDEVHEIFGPGGAIEAFVHARDKGMVRYIGVTGHHDPLITRRCIESFDFDTVLVPVNPAERGYKSFIDGVVPLAQEQQMGIIAMKVYFRGLAARIPGYEGMEPFFRFALSQPISTAVIGCDNVEQLEENINIARSFHPMSKEEMVDLEEFVAPYGRQLMYYKP